MLDVLVVLWNKKGVLNSIKAEIEGFSLSSIDNFGQLLVPWFDDSARIRKLMRYRLGKLMTKLEAMDPKIRIGQRIEEHFNGEKRRAQKHIVWKSIKYSSEVKGFIEIANDSLTSLPGVTP